MIFPIFMPSHSDNHYPSSSVEYKETLVISKYRDEMKFYFKLKGDISWWTKTWNGLDDKFRFVLHSSKKYTKSIEKDLEAGMDFGDVYHKYKELADLGERTVYDEFCGGSPKNIESFWVYRNPLRNNKGRGNKNVSLNPFDAEDTPNNRAFLRRWMKAITLTDDALSEREIARAVTTAFDYLRPEERVMKNLYKSCFSPTGNMRREIYRWVNPDQYGNIFNAENDSLDLKAKRFMAFDFTHIFEDDTLAPAVISYIMHRIQSETGETGVPSLIMIDETAPMLKHPMFRDYFMIGLQEGRKNRQAYMVAFQRANVLDKLGIGDVVRGQAQTVLFFRNPAADISDYEKWNLNPLEMAFIKGQAYPNLKRAVLLSRPVNGESVILNTELGGLGNMLKLFESGRSSVLLAEELYKNYGNNFVEEYLKKQG